MRRKEGRKNKIKESEGRLNEKRREEKTCLPDLIKGGIGTGRWRWLIGWGPFICRG